MTTSGKIAEAWRSFVATVMFIGSIMFNEWVIMTMGVLAAIVFH